MRAGGWSVWMSGRVKGLRVVRECLLKGVKVRLSLRLVMIVKL